MTTLEIVVAVEMAAQVLQALCLAAILITLLKIERRKR